MEGAPLSRVARSPRARRDLIDLWTYLAGHNDAAADALLTRIEIKLKVIADSPGIGSPRPELSDGLRSFSVRSYLLFYRPVKGGIHLVRVLHAARDLGSVDFG